MVKASTSLLLLLVLAVLVAPPCSCSTTPITGFSILNPDVTITHSQAARLDFFTIDSTSLGASVNYIIVEVTIAPTDMAIIIVSGGALPMLCYEFDANPLVTQNGDGTLQQPCAHGYNMNQYLRGTGKYSVIIGITSVSYTQLRLGFFLSSLGVSYQLKVRGRYSLAPNDVCPFNCSTSASTSANCVDRACVCATGRIDYDCSALAKAIVTDPISLALSPSSISYSYFLPSTSASSIGSVRSMLVFIEVTDSSNPVTVYATSESLDPKVILPTAAVNFKTYTIKKSMVV